ncbi:MAG: aminotransferase class I/II-fold pyridoxal phosphate-dependent enzyme, partial [Deltaproteobacteria bacterium]|nr:aminotransferase class I/II-fold pyridoxal phosphate-dependent enzyme [Deltaproteobacteria bacterium]
LEAIPDQVADRAKLMWINYPNNPTGATADRDFLVKAVDFARRHRLVLCADCAYSEIAFDGYRVQSVLELPGAREVAVEFHSMSKTYNMTGWRSGFAAGRRDVVQALANLKSNLDSGVFQAVQVASVAAMQSWPGHLSELNETYRRRRDLLVRGLSELGFRPPSPKATFYVWMPVPGGDDLAFTVRLLEETGVLVTPGSGFGPSGKGYVRFTLTVSEERIGQTLTRFKEAGIGG